jgi:hypothetical protein
MTDSELGAKVIEAVLMLDMAMHGPSQGARDHGREHLGKAVGSLFTSATRDCARAEVENLRRHVSLLRSQFHGIIDLASLVTPEQYARIREALKETAPDRQVFCECNRLGCDGACTR